MAITDLSDVTTTLTKLVETGLKFQGVSDTFFVTAASPDQSFGGPNTVSVHLYHAMESPEFKNLPPTFGSGPTPVRLAPMGLILQYVISVLTQGTEDQALSDAALRQQRYIGFIARTIHDYPVITNKTTITLPGSTLPITIQPTTLLDRNAKLAFILRPAPKEETVSFWSSEEKHVPRLSLFIEARVAVLEPQPPPIAPGIVLTIGQFVFPSSEPQLINTHSAVWFTPPNGPVRKVDATPARVALFDAPGSAALDLLVPPNTPDGDPLLNLLDNNLLTIDAAGLAPGTRSLLLRSSVGNFSARMEIDELASDQPAFNRNWALKAGSDSVTLRVFRDLVDEATGAHKTVLPGIYGMRVLVNDRRASDEPRPRASNELAFPINPQILTAAPASPAGQRRYAITLVGSYLNSSLDIQVSVAGFALTKGKVNPPADGFFFVPDPPAPDDTSNDTDHIVLTMRTKDPETGQTIPRPSTTNPLAVRLVINGATATPAWITVEAP